MQTKKLTLLTAAVMMAAMLPAVTCHASIFAGGDGTETAPYLIETQEQLEVVADLPECSYKLVKDIELTGTWVSLGSLGDKFSGTFDGSGHTIKNASTTLFDENQGTIKNLTVENENDVSSSILTTTNDGTIYNCTVVGQLNSSYSGGISLYNRGEVEQCYARVDVAVPVRTYNVEYVMIGCLVGKNEGVILASYADGKIELQSGYCANGCVGGLVGCSFGNIQDCHATVDLSVPYGYKRISTMRYIAYIGGAVGSAESGSVKNTYAIGKITADSEACMGGLIGRCIGSATMIQNSFYNRTTSGCSDTGKGIPKSTLGMKMKSVYTDWDFDTVWGISEDRNEGYPYLQWQYADVPEDSAAVEITGAIAEDNSLKFVTEAEITGNPDISSFGTTFIPLQLFDDENAKSVNVSYDNDEYQLQNGQTYGASLTDIPEQCKDWTFVGKSYLKDSQKRYTWSEAKTASIIDTTLGAIQN